MNDKKRELILNKCGHKFIFKWEAGQEEKLLDALFDQATDNRTDFDWLDAVIIIEISGIKGSLLREADYLLERLSSRWGSDLN